MLFGGPPFSDERHDPSAGKPSWFCEEAQPHPIDPWLVFVP